MFVNIYAPNKVQDQSRFFDKLNKNIEDCVVNEELRMSVAKCRESWVVGRGRGPWVWVWVNVVGKKKVFQKNNYN